MSNPRMVVLKFETAGAAKRFVDTCLLVEENVLHVDASVAFSSSRTVSALIMECHNEGFEYGTDYHFLCPMPR
jgi:hypothetical protein